MKSLAIALRDTKILIRDTRALLVMLAMPFVLILILGLALGSLWSGDSGVSKFNVGVVDKDGGEVAKAFTKDVLQAKDMKKMLVIETISESTARQSVANGDLAAAIIIPKDFSAKIKAGEKAKFTVLADPGQALRAGIVKAIADSFATNVSAIMIATKTPVTALVKSGAVPPADINALAMSLAAEARQALNDPQVKMTKSATTKNKDVTAIQYYSAGMAVMFVMFGAMFGAFSIMDERHNMTLARMLTSPTGRLSILTGKMGGVFLIGVLQFTALVIATRVFFGVSWGSSSLGVVTLALCTVLAATGVAIFIAAVAKTNKGAAGIAQIIIQLMAIMGGSTIPITVLPPWMQNAAKLTINYWGVTGFRDLMLGKGFGAIVAPSLFLLVFAAGFMAVGVWRFKYD